MLKGFVEAKKHVNASKAIFEKCEVQFSEIAIFDELAEDGEAN